MKILGMFHDSPNTSAIMREIARVAAALGYNVQGRNPRLFNEKDRERFDKVVVSENGANRKRIEAYYNGKCVVVPQEMSVEKVAAVVFDGAKPPARLRDNRYTDPGANFHCEPLYPGGPPALRDGMWAGQRCFIIGGGPSLRDFDWNLLRGELCIAINRAIEYVPDQAIAFTMDARFLDELVKPGVWPGARALFESGTMIRAFSFATTFKREWPVDAWFRRLDNASAMSMSLADGLGAGCNSGFGALNLALNLGASEIYLMGYDMRGAEGRQAHFHGGYEDRPWNKQTDSVYPRMIQHFKARKADIEKRAEVINLSPDSALSCFDKASLDSVALNPSTKPVVVAYYSPEYEAHAARLRASLRPWGFTTDIQAVPAFESWQAGTQHKAEFIRSMLGKHKPRPVFYVDADATFERYPEHLLELGRSDVAVAAHVRDWAKADNPRQREPELLSGSLYFAQSRESKRVVNEWVQENRRKPESWDQANLARVIARGHAKFEPLPADYCAIFDTMTSECPEPVVKHWQASREMRRKVGAAA